MHDLQSLWIESVFDHSALKAALNHVSDACEADAAHLMIADSDRTLLQSTFSCEVPTDLAQREFELQSINPRVAAIPRMKTGKSTRDKDFISRDEIKRDTTYQELILPMGFGHISAVPLINDNRQTAGIALHRAFSDDAFSDAEASRHEALAATAMPALELASQLEKTQSTTLLHQLAPDLVGLVVSRSRRVIDASASADLLFSTRTLRTLPNGVIEFCRPVDQRTFETLARPYNPRAGRFICRSASARQSWVCRVFPVPRAGAIEIRGPVFITFQALGAGLVLDRSLARAAFSLTTTEADIAAALLRGASLDDIATSRGTALSTVRTHLARLFDKTGTRRQAELICVLCELAGTPG